MPEHMDETHAATDPEPRSRWTFTRQLFTWLYALAMLAAVVGLVSAWQIWEPVWGASVQNLITYAIVLLSLLLTLVWLIAFSPLRKETVLVALGLTVLLAAAAVASVRKIEMDGDMRMIVHYRWQPTADDRLAAHRRSASASHAPPQQLQVPSATIQDMPGYRGSDRTGVVTGPPLSQDWQTSPPRQLWKQPCGGGYSSFAVLGDWLVTLEQRGANEAVVCYDAARGTERWVQEYPAAFDETMGGPGPRATPTIADQDVYSYGAEGDLVCIDLESGRRRWHVDALPPGAKNVEWGMSSSPLVVENMVIVEAGGPQGDGLIAYDRRSGDVVWQRPGAVRLIEQIGSDQADNRAGYSSPMLATLHGVRQVLIFDGEGLRSHVPETGEQLWFHEFKNGAGVNVAQPVLLEGGRVFLAQSYAVGCRMIEITQGSGEWSVATLWENLNMKCKFTSPVLHDGFLYGLDEGILVCLDSESGARQWKQGRYGHGQILLTGGQLVVLSEHGDVVLVDADPEQLLELTRFSAINSRKVWNPHALAGGIVYVRNHETMAAYDLRAE